MQKRILTITLAVTVAFFVMLSGCSNKTEQASKAPASIEDTTQPGAQILNGNFAFGGSTTVEPIMTATIEEWKELYPDVHISYEGVGSSSGIKGVLAGTYSLGAASRELKDSEAAQGVHSTPIALDAIAVVVNSDSVPISNLTISDVAKIYAGTITNWKQLGGSDATIVVYNRDEASGTFETFEKKIMGDLEFTKDASITTGNGDMAAKVGSTPNAIGYVGMGFIHEKGLKPLSLNGVDPTIDNVYNGSYAVQRNLNVVYTELGDVEAAFLDYILSKDGQDIVADLDFIPLPSGKAADHYAGDYAFGGSTTVEPIITAAIEEWKDIYPDVHISYEGVGSSSGIKGVLSGIYSLGAASRELKSSEAESGVTAQHIALDAIAIVVNKNSVPISNLSVEEAAKIYAGDITNWKQVGGPDAPIVVYNRDEASGTFETFEKKIMGDYEFMKSASVTTGNGDMAAKVGATPFSIGYVGLGFIKEQGLKALALNGVEPNIDNVYNGSYPVQRFLNVVYSGQISGLERAFVDYLLSEDGQNIVEDLDFIPLP